jgi:hypothetical protein
MPPNFLEVVLFGRLSLAFNKTAQQGTAGQLNVHQGKPFLLLLFFPLGDKDVIDPFHELSVKFRRDLAGFHILVHLFHAAGARDDRAYKGIF